MEQFLIISYVISAAINLVFGVNYLIREGGLVKDVLSWLFASLCPAINLFVTLGIVMEITISSGLLEKEIYSGRGKGK